jgi:hypothetical protein
MLSLLRLLYQTPILVVKFGTMSPLYATFLPRFATIYYLLVIFCSIEPTTFSFAFEVHALPLWPTGYRIPERFQDQQINISSESVK